jgi:hypothetical protein
MSSLGDPPIQQQIPPGTGEIPAACLNQKKRRSMKISSGYVKIAIENGHRNSGFTHKNCDLPIYSGFTH